MQEQRYKGWYSYGHFVNVAFSVPQAIRRAGENRTYFEDEIREAKEMAIKALEQEDAIEKIRAEVKSINLWALRYAPTYDEDIRPQIVSNVKEHVLEIIDKYKEDT